MTEPISERVLRVVRDVPDFPSKGILFKDITPLLAKPELLRDVVDAMCAPFADAGITHIVGVESRGFLFGVPMALAMNAAFVPARKPGKLPWQTSSVSFYLEYGTDSIELHNDAVQGSSRVLVVDDVLATGGTAEAACRLVETLGATVAGVSVLLEIGALNGRLKLHERIVKTVALC